MKPQIIIINGPNLNLLGIRQPETYGNRTFDDYLAELRLKFSNLQIEYFQSNVEGEIINKLHQTGFSYKGIVLNAGGYTHTSVAIGDAIAAIPTPVVEVHISNIYAREEFRQKSLLSAHCKGIVAGFGLQSYEFAIRSFSEQ
ncbi:MAG: type II 3-dehydroquinate dehydratase [Bacteroidetes bacterium]|jgi:3-dehydroquinate dehydratase-2|nr:type II 3-dehydroquinate dehydratase [Bacteroidota bacterium]